jgi:hypothetical protein
MKEKLIIVFCYALSAAILVFLIHEIAAKLL